MDFPQEGVKELSRRFVPLYVAVLIFILFVVFRLGFLQLVRGDYFWIASSEHTIKEIRIPAARGLIFDRNGLLLGGNRPSFDLVMVPQYVQDREAVKRALVDLTPMTPELFEDRWSKAKDLPAFFPITQLSDISYDLASRLRVLKVTAVGAPDRYDLRGVEVIPRPLRSYPSGIVSPVTLGYLGEISERDLVRFKEKFPSRYFPGDLVGAAGVEKTLEPVLKGKEGYRQRVVEATGREVASEDVQYLLRNERPVPGSSVVLTLDLGLQRTAEEQFRGKSGALVAMDPRSGEILALVSEPSFDPSRLTVNVSPAFWQSLVNDPRKPFLHRGLQGYPPGSTFKIVTALAALEEKELKLNEKVTCPGGLLFGRRFFRCWKEGGHGPVELHRAIVESCDTFFYTLGARLGVDRLARYARLMGLGKATGVELEDEKPGLVPTSEWKKKNRHEEWLPSEDLSVAVGQGPLLITPIQNAVLLAQIVNGGRSVRPTLVKEVLEQGKEVRPRRVETEEGLPEANLKLSPDNLLLVQNAMAGVVAEPSGTAHGIRSHRVAIGGKTGTAQVISEEGRIRAGGGREFMDHAWFIAYAPEDNPTIVVSVLVEHGGFGASAAAPIAKAVIEKFMELGDERGATFQGG